MTFVAEQLLAGVDTDEPRSMSFCGGTVFLFTRRSPDRETVNEDAALALDLGGGQGVLAVADGVGGGPQGARASAAALSSLRSAAKAGAAPETSLREAILSGCERAQKEVSGLTVGAATTLAVLEVVRGTVRTYHVGDSGVFIVGQRGRRHHLTLFHSPAAYAVEAGLITETEALAHRDRHLVSNAIGAPDMRVDLSRKMKLSPRDTVLLASDGLFDNLTLDEITEIIRKGPLAKAMANLIGSASARMTSSSGSGPSKPDDLTILLYRRTVRRPSGRSAPATPAS